MRVEEVRKICFVVPYAYLFFKPEAGTHFGGAERQAYLLGKKIAEHEDIKVHYCVADFGQPEHEVIDGCELWSTFSSTDGLWKAFKSICRYLKLIDADDYIFRAVNPSIFFFTLYIRFFLRKKVVYMVANKDEGSLVKVARMSGTMTAIMMLLTYPLVDLLTTQTEEQCAFFKNKKNKRVIHLPNVFDESLNLKDHQEIERKYVLWVGRSDLWKQPEMFITLAKSFPDIKFQMVCQPANDQNRYLELQQSAETLPNLTFLGAVSPQRINALYLEAMLFVLTSISEGFANTMMEAMSASCAILTLGTDPDNIITGEKMGLVAKDYDELCVFLDSLVSHPETMQKMGNNARDFLLREHSSNRVTELFKQALV